MGIVASREFALLTSVHFSVISRESSNDGGSSSTIMFFAIFLHAKKKYSAAYMDGAESYLWFPSKIGYEVKEAKHFERFVFVSQLGHHARLGQLSEIVFLGYVSHASALRFQRRAVQRGAPHTVGLRLSFPHGRSDGDAVRV